MLITVYDEDDELFAHLLVTTARRLGHSAQHVTDLRQIDDAFITHPTAVIVGVGRLGDDVIAQVGRLRARHEQSLIVVAAEGATPSSTIAAIETGASNVVRKPLLPRELITWIERAVQVTDSEVPGGRIQVADLDIDLHRVLASKAGAALSLTRMEFRLLYCLAQHVGRVTPTDRLITFGGDADEIAASSLKSHMSHLRTKLRAAGGAPVRITARQMLGYVLEVDEKDAGVTAR